MRAPTCARVAGATTLGLGGLELQSTQAHGIPLHDDGQITATGSVIIENNTNLCQCQADAFLASLSAGGFTGTARATGNGSCTTPCTPRATCP